MALIKRMNMKETQSHQATGPSHPIYGVNLGGWLMLERWMTPSLFGEGELDEYTLCHKADNARLAAIKNHYETFITSEDFAWLADQGITAVRLPLTHGMFGDGGPYLETVAYVDKAFVWAKQYGIKILLDLHTAAGSQNGRQESGHIGSIDWHTDPNNILQTLHVLKRLAQRYGSHDALLGIELLNEPSHKIPRRQLKKFYEAAYEVIRKEAGEDIWIVFHDAFKARRHKRTLNGAAYTNVYLDTHIYRAFNWLHKRTAAVRHSKLMMTRVRRQLRRINKHHPYIVGEWSMALNPDSLRGLPPSKHVELQRVYGAAQQVAYGDAAAWFYWSYKTESPDVWNFRTSVERGWLAVSRDTKS